jgi:hypothetical protein
MVEAPKSHGLHCRSILDVCKVLEHSSDAVNCECAIGAWCTLTPIIDVQRAAGGEF